MGRGRVQSTSEPDVVSTAGGIYVCTRTNYGSHDIPQIDAAGLASVDLLGVNFDGTGDLGGWTGGRVVIVPTDKSIDQWQPIGEREL